MSEKRPRLTERPTTRLLDTYGVPYSQKRKQQHVSDFDTNDTSYLGTEPSVMSKPKPPLNLIPMNELQQRIRVCVRKRPLNKRETASNEADIASIVGSRTVELHAEKNRIDLSRFVETHSFTFDEAFDSHVTNQEIYARTAQPLIEYIFAGGNGTCFAFGQTGSGKTYTMLDSNDGLYVLAAQDIFRMLNQPNHSHLSASVGFYEIYQGQLYDLLNNRNKLAARDDGNNNVVIAGLKEYPIKNKEDLMGVFEYGNQGRTTGRTGVNNKSSRSHAVLQIILRAQHRSTETYGKLTFIDLAGSERGVDRGDANPKTRLEGAEINKSLLALKECIRALDQDKKHTPFRGSKLTQVLRDCFIGNARTCMIATISPNSSNAEHTLNTLRYADRVKQFKGESDPRLAPDFYSNINSHVKNENSTIEVAEEESTAITFEDAMEEDYDDELEESQSVTNSCVIDEEDKVENLFDVDFPVEVTTNALNTPTNNRFYSLREERQEQFMKRLESPPAELFLSRLTDPFDSKPLDFMQEDKNMHFPDTLEEHKDTMNNNNANSSSSRIDVERVRRFIKFHRAQIKDLENCLKEEKKVIAKLSLAINTTDMDEVDEDEYTKQEYENYLNDLNELLARSMSCMEIIQEKIKTELDG
ncbi:hypothetical protein RMATCC62417_00756 [Rhizopus microsporus]|nr:hypothetical protein RMATCC62417_00756 [Rhizopus microsporus]